MAVQAAPSVGQPTAVRSGGLRWLGVGGLVVVAALVGGLIGWAAAGGIGPTSDTSFVDRSIAAWSDNDAAQLADLYAPGAVFQDLDAGERYAGLERIKEYVASLDPLGFVVERAGPTIRYGDYLVTPVRYGRVGDMSSAISILRVEDGKVTYHTGWTVANPSS
jgi:hypothetical protein